MRTIGLYPTPLTRRGCVAGLLSTSAMVSGCTTKAPEPLPIVLPQTKLILPTPPELRAEVEQFLRAKNLSWDGLVRKHIEAETSARKCARAQFDSTVATARQDMLDTIGSDFVGPYFNWFNQTKQSTICGFRWVFGLCAEYLERDFERTFRGINERPMIGAWHKSVDMTLAEYEKQQQLSVRYFYFSQIGLTDQQFSNIMTTINVNPTGAAKRYAEKAGLFDNKLLEVLKSGRDLCNYSKQIGEVICKVSRQEAQNAVATSAADRIATGVVNRLAAKMGIELTAEATARIVSKAMLVVGILVEGIFAYKGYEDRKEQRRLWMKFFQTHIAKEEDKFFNAIIGHARDASLNKDIVTALNLAGASRHA